MSEYQYIGFRAIDRPVSEKNLSFMRRQSSRAEITPWSFENEYDYGNFRGNAMEMLRRGYDIHLHYTNFGIRKLLIRFPISLPNTRLARSYFVKNSLQFLKDKRGAGGILLIDPFYEAGDLDELWDVDTLLERLVSLRAEVLDGDPRPLYLAQLAVACDNYRGLNEMREGPVPAGLDALSDAQAALVKLYGLSKGLIAAATRKSPPMPTQADSAVEYSKWLKQQPQKAKDEWLNSLMADPNSGVRAEILTKYRTDRSLPTWPTAQANRTIAELRAVAKEIALAAQQKAAKKATRQRAQRLAAMRADPTSTLRETEQLVAKRTTQAYCEVAQLLSDLREALAASGRANVAETQARKLKDANPRLYLLTKELRRHGFVPK